MTTPSLVGARASIPNPALKPLDFLLGEWRTRGSHPQLPDKTLLGRASFAWHEGGAFLIMRTQIEEPGFPDGMAIFASDDVAGRFAMTYFDERGTSRLFEVSVGDRSVTWRRDDPRFSQSYVLTAGLNGDTLVGRGRMSQSGGAWVDDLSLTYERAATPDRGPAGSSSA